MAEVSKTIANHRRLHKSEYEKLILVKNAKHGMLPILTCRTYNSATQKPSWNLDEIMIWQCLTVFDIETIAGCQIVRFFLRISKLVSDLRKIQILWYWEDVKDVQKPWEVMAKTISGNKIWNCKTFCSCMDFEHFCGYLKVCTFT